MPNATCADSGTGFCRATPGNSDRGAAGPPSLGNRAQASYCLHNASNKVNLLSGQNKFRVVTQLFRPLGRTNFLTVWTRALSIDSVSAEGARVHENKEANMSGVRVLVGTHKGAFVLTADGKRDKWDVTGPFFAGWEIYHLKGSPADPDRIYASQTSGWFGQIIQRSSDGGKTWETPGGEKVPQAGPPPRASATSLCTIPAPKAASLSPRTSGTTARSIPGSSSASGISSPR